MTIKKKLEHAQKFQYPVIVEFRGCTRKGLIEEIGNPGIASFVMSSDNHVWHNYSAVLSVMPCNATLEPDAPEPESDILDQVWEYTDDPAYAGGGVVIGQKGQVNFNDYKREIAALPDALRALVMVWEIYPLGFKDGAQVMDVLKKAGVVK